LDPALSIPVRFTDEAGAPLDLRAAGWGYVSPVVVATLQPPSATLPGIEGRNAAYYAAGFYEDRGPFGGGEKLDLAPEQDGILHLRAPLPVWVSAVLRDQVVETRRLDGSVGEIVFEIPRPSGSRTPSSSHRPSTCCPSGSTSRPEIHVSGPYRILLRDGAGALLLERALELGEEPVVLDVPLY
jgi:hypothetical protein